MLFIAAASIREIFFQKKPKKKAEGISDPKDKQMI